MAVREVDYEGAKGAGQSRCAQKGNQGKKDFKFEISNLKF